QQALACAAVLARSPARPRDLKVSLPDAPKILARNVYGWFLRPARGVYALSEGGRAALTRWKALLPADASDTIEPAGAAGAPLPAPASRPSPLPSKPAGRAPQAPRQQAR